MQENSHMKRGILLLVSNKQGFILFYSSFPPDGPGQHALFPKFLIKNPDLALFD